MKRFAWVAPFIFVGCGLKYNFEMSNVLSLDGVKLIRSDISDPKDPSSFQQQYYTVDRNARLLMRYEALSKEVGNVNVDSGNHLWLRITLDDPKVSTQDALAAMKLCFLKKRWTMHATWNWSVPMFGEKWNGLGAGGDWVESECASAVLPEKALEIDPNAQVPRDNLTHLYFDVTNWYVNELRGRKKNDGFILTSMRAVTFFGDASSNYSPRLLCRMGKW